MSFKDVGNISLVTVMCEGHAADGLTLVKVSSPPPRSCLEEQVSLRCFHYHIIIPVLDQMSSRRGGSELWD